MVAKNLIKTVFDLPIADRLDLFQKLRENLLNDPAIDEVSDAEKQLISERISRATPEDFSPWEDVNARLEAILKERA